MKYGNRAMLSLPKGQHNDKCARLITSAGFIFEAIDCTFRAIGPLRLSHLGLFAQHGILFGCACQPPLPNGGPIGTKQAYTGAPKAKTEPLLRRCLPFSRIGTESPAASKIINEINWHGRFISRSRQQDLL